MRPVVGLSLLALAPALCACGGLLGSGAGPAPAPIAAGGDPTPLAKCKVAADSTNPLVTEWPASEKAHLQSLTSDRAVAVEYSGCELRIIDACHLSGSYRWQRTTLATDTVEIDNADELYAKLPIGAAALEGELDRSGHLAVQTTVAGQLTLDGMSATPSESPECAEATHYISAISVGAFKLLSGSKAAGGGQVGVLGVGAGAHSARKESILKQAGIDTSCAEATDTAPESQCASPIQVFLQPIRHSGKPPPAQAAAQNAAKNGAIEIAFPAPEDSDETWTLRDRAGSVLCTLPCTESVPPVSGYYLQREKPHAEVKLPASFAHKPGTRVSAEYQIGRGNPTLAALAFYGAGIPTAALGTGLVIWGIVQAGCTKDPNDPTKDCFPAAGFLIGSGAFFLAASGASLWWYLWSQEEKVDTFERLPAGGQSAARPRPRIMIGPGSISGTF